jgi:dolichol-phosphate mannosyltransferase
METVKNIVIIPTYNEKENIEEIIREIMKLEVDFDVLVVDDASPDGTADIVMAMMEIFQNRIALIQRCGKLGLGTAYIEGFKWALKNNYTYIYEMDADFSHNPKDLIKLFEACRNGADVAVGSRYKTGVNVVNWPMSRILLSFGASIYVKFITGMKINDPTAGFVAYNRIVLERINLDNIKMIGYAFQIELKFKANLMDFIVVEVPIIFTDRKKGTSKMSKNIIGEAFFGVIIMKLKSLFIKNNFIK